MKGDFTRFTFNPKKHYSSVRMQQGRVQLDADWNEQMDIQSYLNRATAVDLIGSTGAPRDGAGFGIIVEENQLKDLTDLERDAALKLLRSGEFLIDKGRFYIDGIACENEEIVPYSNQPDYSSGKPPEDGTYLVYLKAWERHVTAVEDPKIREVALGGPDTTTRTKVVWQVKLTSISDLPDSGEDIRSKFMGSRRKARMAARTRRGEESAGPCVVPAAEGYRGLENHLYRVEIHEEGKVGKATFKWSKDNGSISRAVHKIEGNVLTISNPGQDIALLFPPGQWVEIRDRRDDNFFRPGVMALVESAEGSVLTVKPEASSNVVDNIENAFPLEHVPKVIQWDSGEVRTIEEEHWIKVERIGKNRIILSYTEEDHSNCLRIYGKDVLQLFTPGQWVEMTNSAIESRSLEERLEARVLARIEKLVQHSPEISSEGRSFITLILDQEKGNAGEITGEKFPFESAPRVRQWEWENRWIELEEGIEVCFRKKDDYYRSGDYWLIPARSITGRIEWPEKDGQTVFLERFGIDDYFCPLAAVKREGGSWRVIHDYRQVFLPLAGRELMLAFLGGDGQEGMPGEPLPAPFRVRVARNGEPEPGARVKFFIASGKGRLAAMKGAQAETIAQEEGALIIRTDHAGVAECLCSLAIDPMAWSLQAEAVLLDGKGDTPQTIRFAAKASTAGQVFYRPPEKCAELEGAGSVQEALDRLSYSLGGGSSAVTVGEGGQFRQLDEAVNALIAQGQKSVLISLLPGQHGLDGLQINGTLKNLNIRGCGPGTVLNLGKEMRLERLRSLVISDLRIEGKEPSGAMIHIGGCGSVALRSCDLRLKSASGNALLHLEKVRRILLENSTLQAGARKADAERNVALSIQRCDGDVVVAGNRIQGLVCLYRGSPANREDFSDTMKRFSTKATQLHFRVQKGTLQLRGNTLTGLAVGSEMLKDIRSLLERSGKPPRWEDIFRMVFLTDNVIAQGDNQLLAVYLSLSANRFEKEDADVAWAIANTAIYLGNFGYGGRINSISRVKEKAANAVEIVEY